MKIDYATHNDKLLPVRAGQGLSNRVHRLLTRETRDSLHPLVEFMLMLLMGWLAAYGAWQAPHIMTWLGLPIKFSPILHAAMAFITVISLRAPFVFLRNKVLRQFIDIVLSIGASILVIRHMQFVVEMPLRYMNYQGLFEIPLVHA